MICYIDIYMYMTFKMQYIAHTTRKLGNTNISTIKSMHSKGMKSISDYHVIYWSVR